MSEIQTPIKAGEAFYQEALNFYDGQIEMCLRYASNAACSFADDQTKTKQLEAYQLNKERAAAWESAKNFLTSRGGKIRRMIDPV